MPSVAENIAKSLLLPELRVIKQIPNNRRRYRVWLVEKTTPFEVCPHCAGKCTVVYDRVICTIRDVMVQNKYQILKIRKRRFLCKSCHRIFREQVRGIFSGFRTTQRFRKHIMWCAANFSNLRRVASHCRVSSWLVYKAFYEQLDLDVRKYQTPWPKTLGIDEHSFMRHQQLGYREFATVFVDYSNRKVRELSYGRYLSNLRSCEDIVKIPGRENVKNVVMDLSSSFKTFSKEMFPNAIITADKFHVVKLLNPSLQKYMKQVLPEDAPTRNNPLRLMLLKSGKKLKRPTRRVLKKILIRSKNLKEVYDAKEAIFKLYRIKGYKRACRAFTAMTDQLALSTTPEVHRFRRTLLRWRHQILNYFRTKITNGRTEGYNRKAKLIQRNAYGFRNFNNYRLRVLYACR